ncbi:hypothetical protein VCM39_12530 [Bacteroides sp. CG01]|uniref:hypothetical protein n=1 Tax=Bacteroides sp. CG01 TaxID=3096000 RepID=UPI002AFE92E4|nr:hypothetical protein [Bacteroides sp. CG01]
MENSNFLFFPENSNQEEFDFNSLIGNKEYALIAGIAVNVDRIIRDITKTTVIAVSGTVVIKGIKMRGVWDAYGNPIEFKQMITILLPRKCNIQSIISGYNPDLFRLVHVEKSKEV